MSFVDGTYVAQFAGAAGGDNAGWSVSGAGDVNGDGYDDIIIGAYGASPASRNAAGSSYVVFGKATGLSNVDLATFSSASDNVGFRIDGGAASDNAGVSVSGAGDVNGDGYDDVIIGAYTASPSAGTYAGSSYVVFGKASGFSNVDLASFSSASDSVGYRIDGAAAGDFSGVSVSGAGDVNGDSYADVVVGAHLSDPSSRPSAGSSYVLFGKASGFSNVALSTLVTASDSVGFRIDGAAAGDYAGYSVSGAGDVNGDGYGDVIVGAYAADPSSRSQAGSSYVVFGNASDFSNVDLASFGSAADNMGYRIDGAVADDQAGYSVSYAGDLNADGFADVIVGAFNAAPKSRSSAGSSYALQGKTSGFSNVDLSGEPSPSDTSSSSDSFWSSTGTGLVGGLGALFIAVTAAVLIKAYVYPTTGNAEGSGKTAVELKTAVAPQSEEL